MTTQSMSDFQYVHLNAQFYQDFNHCEQIMKDEHRQYLHVLAKYKGNTFMIPFRSNVNHPYGFHFGKDEHGKDNLKGLDYRKAVIINNFEEYAYFSKKNIPQYQHDKIMKHTNQIKRKFEKFVDDYCKAVLKNDERVLNRIGTKSALQYFHTELGLI